MKITPMGRFMPGVESEWLRGLALARLLLRDAEIPFPERHSLTRRYIHGIYYTVSAPDRDRLLRCTGFQWDSGNATKVLTRHNVDPGECEQIFFVEPVLVTGDEKHSGTEPRWRALGQTLARRRLHIVFTIRDDLIRVIAARDMNRGERQAYDQIKARFKEDPDFQD